MTEEVPWHGQPFSLTIKVAPLAMIILKAWLNSKILEEETKCFQIKKALSKPI
ncbi:1,4-alpha-glucan (glycogen) branching enzyme, GH-13-type [Desulfosporosinus metallidurans]|uniref:1,4-alpha-glucan (Glycogen) branching enzyme, GH-13-type n=1 Tax=Desulfosporosinus metallidurans TaxID=1888891 RepID=A0A1Q8QPW2_9FIRM|nr:1,4-alpha-glucan (glycogen) branching enzyme, GH-13-type [Desulfosporosinus metallidurans]